MTLIDVVVDFLREQSPWSYPDCGLVLILAGGLDVFDFHELLLKGLRCLVQERLRPVQLVMLGLLEDHRLIPPLFEMDPVVF